MEKFRCRVVSWEQIELWTKSIVEKLRADKFEPDMIVALARGGLVPARLLSDYIHVKDLYSVKTEHWGITATRDGTAVLSQKLPIDVSGKNILVVDDITDTGQSLKLATEHILELKPEEVKTTTLLHITHSKFIPDYYASEVPHEEWTWFIFPWNVYEDLRHLITISFEGEMDVNAVQKRLKDNFGIDIPHVQIREALSDLEARGDIKNNGGQWIKQE